MTKLSQLLASQRTTVYLVIINAVIAFIIFNISSKAYFHDALGYWRLGESILHGKFSGWYHLTKYYPDSLRTPGYPLFLAVVQLFSDSRNVVKLLQLMIYFLSLFFCLKLIDRWYPNSTIIKNVFLILLIPNVQIVYYTGYISAEILAVFFMILIAFYLMEELSLKSSLMLAFSSYFLFMMRPAFLLLPFCLSGIILIHNRKKWKPVLLYLVVFVVLLIPFGIWNKVNHGVFKVTPLEGGGGVAHLGYWQLKLADDYKEKFYWGNVTGGDLLKPDFFTKDEIKSFTNEFEKEWKDIMNSTKQLVSLEDSIYLDSMRSSIKIFPIYNSEFTRAREEVLWSKTIENIRSDFSYYIKSRVYHFIRAYVTGINQNSLADANSFKARIQVLYPFIVTLIFIFGGLIFVLLRAFKRPFNIEFLLLLSICLYSGIIHVPFTNQSRYTIPCQLIVIALTSISLCQIVFKEKLKRLNE